MFMRIFLPGAALALTVGAASADNHLVALLTQIAGAPEPAKFALLLLGFGAVGFALRDRRRLFGTTAAHEI
jgi:hypothetical protein